MPVETERGASLRKANGIVWNKSLRIHSAPNTGNSGQIINLPHCINEKSRQQVPDSVTALDTKDYSI